MKSTILTSILCMSLGAAAFADSIANTRMSAEELRADLMGRATAAAPSRVPVVSTRVSEQQQSATGGIIIPLLMLALVAAAVVLKGPERARAGALKSLKFDWAGATAKHLGTVSHRLLQELGSRGAADLPPSWMQTAKRFARGQLRALGVPGDELDDAVGQLGASLETTLSSERGRWLFSAAQRETAAELPLSAFDHGQAVHVIIDRTFVDVEGRRWIIDFKTGLHSGGSLDAFLNSEVLRYRAQLERYGRIMSGLYFPLLDAWREWPYEP